MKKSEEWRPVVGYEGLYEVSSLGRIRGLDRVSGNVRMVFRQGCILKQRPRRRDGRITVRLSKHGRSRPHQLHRVVLEAFVGSCPAGMECRHLNGKASDNRLSNLAWGTHTENIADRERHGQTMNGERHGRSKLNEMAVRVILRLRESGMKEADIAEYWGVSKGHINAICLGYAWKHLSGDRTPIDWRAAKRRAKEQVA